MNSSGKEKGCHYIITVLLTLCILFMGAGLAKEHERLIESELRAETKAELMRRGHGDVVTDSIQFEESSKWLNNPNRGFYYIYGFYINDDKADYTEEVAKRFCRDTETRLSMIQISLQKYRDKPISEQGLENIENLFDSLEKADRQFIVRFLYDWDGENQRTEPENIDIILEHMRQTGPVLREHKDIIFTLQGLFIGNWGEMNGTKYSNQEDMRTLAEQLYEATGGEIFLAVRMPMQWRMVTGMAFPEDAAKDIEGNSTLSSKLGLYNDGMLGSWSDYGTYGDQTKEEHGYFTYWNRMEELEFQEELCKSVPIGGEVIVDNSYNDFENALSDMKQMHVTYLNKDFDKNVLNKWAESTYTGEGCFNGMDGLSYMERHIGYRLWITGADLDYSGEDDMLSVNVNIQNVGFAPVYRPMKIWFYFVDRESGAVHSYPAEYDLRGLTGGNDAGLIETVNMEMCLTGNAEGKYDVYIDFTDEASGDRILMANVQEAEEYGYQIGLVELKAATYVEPDGEKVSDWWSRLISW